MKCLRGVTPIKPARLDQLSSREWKALSHALALEKSARTTGINELVKELFPRNNLLLIKVAVGVAIVSLLGASWFAWRQHQNKLKTRATVAEKIAAAQTCFAQSDFTCAIEQSLVAVNLDPQNTAAAQLLQSAQIAKQNRADEETIVRLLQEANDCLVRDDIACTQVKARDILALDEDHLQAQQLLQKANQLTQTQAINDLVQQAETCLQQNDIACAELFYGKANEMNAGHVAVQALGVKLASYQQSRLAQEQALAQQVQQGLSEANQCFIRKDYGCTVRAAERVLQLEPANSQAVELKQSASLAQQQAKDVAQKVNKLLGEANSCMDKKNYSCAIAKAESALDLSPGHKQALAMKNRAQETQRKLKESGFTIK
jgi:citrate lyase gamma subunit